MAELPHAYPFRFVEPRGGSGDPPGARPIVVPSSGAALPGPRAGGTPSPGGYPLSLAIEAMAQSVLAAPPTEASEGGKEGSGGRAHLAGIEAARLLAEIRPGDRLEGRSELQGRFGPALKVRCELTRDGEPVAEATLLLTMTD